MEEKIAVVLTLVATTISILSFFFARGQKGGELLKEVETLAHVVEEMRRAWSTQGETLARYDERIKQLQEERSGRISSELLTLPITVTRLEKMCDNLTEGLTDLRIRLSRLDRKDPPSSG
jgi:hypothetical protein